MAVWRTRVSGSVNGLGFVVTLAAAACSNSGGSGTKSTTCSGSSLVNDPTGHGCVSNPPPPTQNCTTPLMGITPTFSAVSTTPFEAESKVAVDPRPNQNNVFVATIQSDVGPNTSGETTSTCLIAKHIAVYKADGSGTLTPMSGLPAPLVNEWATDPDIAVGPDGTLYLTFLRWTGPCGDSVERFVVQQVRQRQLTSD